MCCLVDAAYLEILTEKSLHVFIYVGVVVMIDILLIHCHVGLLSL